MDGGEYAGGCRVLIQAIRTESDFRNTSSACASQPVPLAAALFFVIRPLAALLFLIKTPTGRVQRLMLGWFGIRGIGSLYYLSYALNHGLNDKIADTVGITLSVVALSIFIHGISSQPILNFYERKITSEKSNN